MTTDRDNLVRSWLFMIDSIASLKELIANGTLTLTALENELVEVLKQDGPITWADTKRGLIDIAIAEDGLPLITKAGA